MTSPLHASHALRWLGHSQVSRAMTRVLGIIGVSLLFSALRVVDAAFSGATMQAHLHATRIPPASATATLHAIDRLGIDEPPGLGEPVDASLVKVPEAAAAAISL